MNEQQQYNDEELRREAIVILAELNAADTELAQVSNQLRELKNRRGQLLDARGAAQAKLAALFGCTLGALLIAVALSLGVTAPAQAEAQPTPKPTLQRSPCAPGASNWRACQYYKKTSPRTANWRKYQAGY